MQKSYFPKVVGDLLVVVEATASSMGIGGNVINIPDPCVAYPSSPLFPVLCLYRSSNVTQLY